MKRYAIVRVDKYPICPLGFKHKCKDFMKTGVCDDCRHGDTKEQLIRKVAQAILRTLKGGEVLKYEECGIGFIKQPVSVEYLAKEIVEFLGVK